MFNPTEKMFAELAIKEALKNESEFVQACTITAKFMFDYFQALIKEGFNPDQALKIVMAHGCDPGKLGSISKNGFK
jgi:hypothetical protein